MRARKDPSLSVEDLTGAVEAGVSSLRLNCSREGFMASGFIEVQTSLTGTGSSSLRCNATAARWWLSEAKQWKTVSKVTPHGRSFLDPFREGAELD